jgi:hyperosmotically inducible periplasmic protein
MKTRALPIMAAFCMGALMVPLAGCNRDTNPVHAERDAQGNTHVTVDNQQVNRNVNQADQSLKKTGDEIKDGANQAGAAIQRGAEKVGNQIETKVVPAAKEALSNANITAKVKSRLAQDPAINALYVNVDTDQGRVTLSGKVALPEQKAEAEKVARETDGVKDVVNQIQVTGNVPAGSGS